MTTLDTYLSIANNMTRWEKLTAASPDVTTATKYFQANIGKVTSIDGLINNTRLFTYVMTAYGLSDMTYAKGMIKKVIEEGTSSNKALANTLNNANILALARAFDFATNGASTTQSTTLQSTVVSNYVQQQLQTNQGKDDPGVQLALYFQTNAPNLTSVYGILGDKKLLTVVQTALGISSATSAQNIDVQAKQLGSKINLADFKDPKKLEAFIARFSAMYDYYNTQNGTTPTSQSSLTNPILVAASGQTGFSVDLLTAMQGLKIGG